MALLSRVLRRDIKTKTIGTCLTSSPLVSDNNECKLNSLQNVCHTILKVASQYITLVLVNNLSFVKVADTILPAPLTLMSS